MYRKIITPFSNGNLITCKRSQVKVFKGSFIITKLAVNSQGHVNCLGYTDQLFCPVREEGGGVTVAPLPFPSSRLPSFLCLSVWADTTLSKVVLPVSSSHKCETVFLVLFTCGSWVIWVCSCLRHPGCYDDRLGRRGLGQLRHGGVTLEGTKQQ